MRSGSSDTESDIIKSALPMNRGSCVDVRTTHGYSAPASPDKLTDSLFQGFDSEELFLSLCIDWGFENTDDAKSKEASQVYFEDSQTLVLAIL